LKDFGQPHFQMVTQGISDEQLINWQHDYGLIQNLFVERKEITKTNCFKLSTNFYRQHLCPLPPEHLTLNCIFQFMVNSPKYYPSAHWASAPTRRVALAQ
jgi:hypothetical protein